MTSTTSSNDNTTTASHHSANKHHMSKSVKTAARELPRHVENAARALHFVPQKAHEYTWEELQLIERRRRSILVRTEGDFWDILKHWRGTCLPMISRDTLFWITLLLYVLVRIHARLGDVPDYAHDLGNGNIGLIGGFLTFLLIVFVRSSNIRYFKLYDHSMACKGRILDTATLAVTYLPKATANRLIRYMNAAHVAGYTGVSKTYSSRSFFEKLNRDFGLLTETEMRRMKEMDLDAGGSCNREIIAWCMNEIQQAHKSITHPILDDRLAQQFRDQLLQLRSAIGQWANAKDLPIPFFYVHFICLLTAMYLPLFAVSVGYRAGTGDESYWTADVVVGLVVILQSVFVIGLRMLGQQVSDPYGDDAIDLSVIFYVTFTWRMSNRIMKAQFPQITEEALAEEALLEQNRTEPLGAAWEQQDLKEDSRRQG